MIEDREHGMIALAKMDVRRRVWELLQREGAARFPGTEGRIPHFIGAEDAADLLTSLPAWNGASVVKVNPDVPQLPVRARALAAEKLLYMPVPRLSTEQPFLLLDPALLPDGVTPRRAASISGASQHGKRVGVGDVRPLDLIVCGSVAVNRDGVRIGKGGGFSDLEFALLAEVGLVDEKTMLVTTVHPLQILDEELPETSHDFRVDVIVTPDEVVECPRANRPAGVLWEHLDEAKVASVPALGAVPRRGD